MGVSLGVCLSFAAVSFVLRSLLKTAVLFNMKKSSEASVVDYRTCVYPVPYVPLRIDFARPVEGGVRQLLRRLRPEWPTELVLLKVSFLFQKICK